MQSFYAAVRYAWSRAAVADDWHQTGDVFNWKDTLHVNLYSPM